MTLHEGQGIRVADSELQRGSSGCTAERHGTSTAYRDGCRCPETRRVMADAQARRVKRRYLEGPLRTNAVGTHRRLQALQANGWPRRTLAGHLGRTSGCLPELARDVIHVDTAATVRALYVTLADVPGPSESARRRAQAKGWLPPLWWDDDRIDDPDYDPLVIENVPDIVEVKDSYGRRFGAGDNVVDGPPWHQLTNDFINSLPDVDPIAVERVLSGEATPSTLNRDEKTIAVRQLLVAGRTVSEVSRRLHISGQYVRIYAARAGLDASYPSASGGTISATPDQFEEATA